MTLVHKIFPFHLPSPHCTHTCTFMRGPRFLPTHAVFFNRIVDSGLFFLCMRRHLLCIYWVWWPAIEHNTKMFSVQLSESICVTIVTKLTSELTPSSSPWSATVWPVKFCEIFAKISLKGMCYWKHFTAFTYCFLAFLFDGMLTES